MTRLIAAALLLAANASAIELECGTIARLQAPVDSSQYRKYAPPRQVDVLDVAVDITPDFRNRSISARTTLKFLPLQEDLRELRLNAEDLRVSEIKSGGTSPAWQNTGTELIVTLPQPLKGGQELTITYTAFPKSGLYFRSKELGYLPEDEHLFTQGEDIEARHWIPCFDHPNEKFTSSITCHVPSELVVLSNGSLASEIEDGHGQKTVTWEQKQPHTSYLISLVAGNFKKLEDKYKDIPLAFFTPASQFANAQASFEETKEMMAFFEKEIGVDYPWDKYFQVCVQDFMFGGMENTSISTLTDRTLFPPETENIRSSQGLVAHELAHQWFGDLVTCRDWAHVWLNEGFATYYAHLYNGYKDGRDEFLYGLYNSARGFIGKSSAEDSRPIVFRGYEKPTELFGYLVYPKGGWVLHMLRHELGEETYRKCIQTYLERRRFNTAITSDLMAVIEEVTGQPWEQFFDQWVYHPHHPEIKASYSWDENVKQARLLVSQIQQLTNGIALFNFPLDIRFLVNGKPVDRNIRIKEKEETFIFHLDAQPEQVRIDPDYNLLAKISFSPPRQMLLAQLANTNDVIGRIEAINELKKSKDAETVRSIRRTLESDPFYGVRIEAAEALRSIHNDDALAALLAAADQKDARVRQRVVMAIGSFYDSQALQFTRKVLKEEKNPDIQHHAAKGLAGFADGAIAQTLIAALKGNSWENIVAMGAIQAMKAQASPEFIAPLLEKLSAEGRQFTSRDFASALETLAFLARENDKQEMVYGFLARQTEHPAATVRTGAIQALGVLKDQRAIGLLSKFAAGDTSLPETARANRALENIRSSRPVTPELQTLRSEVMELKSANQDLKKKMEELSKKLDNLNLRASRKAKKSAPPKAGKSR